MTCPSKPRLKLRPVEGAWYDIPGFGGRYQINSRGQVKNMAWAGNPIMRIKRAIRQGEKVGYERIELTRSNRHRNSYAVWKLMVMTFFTKCNTDELRAIYRDGDITNHTVDNLEFMGNGQFSRICQAKRKVRPVAEINAKGEIIEVYRNAAQAGKAYYMSANDVLNRCRGKIKSEFRHSETSFRWLDDTESIERLRKADT